MPGFLRRFFLSDFGPPPRPDVAQQWAFRGQRLIETIYSDSKRERAFITFDEPDFTGLSLSGGIPVIGRNGSRLFGVAARSAVTRTRLSERVTLLRRH
jgi:hypothetical protein